MKKSIAIYNPYLYSMGGGEKVVLVMAEHLAKDFSVILIARRQISLKKLEDYFSVDLKGVKLEIMGTPSVLLRLFTTSRLPWPGRFRNIMSNYADAKQLKNIKTDLFINSLYGSSLRSIAREGVYICNFPHKLPVTLRGKSIFKKLYNVGLDVFESMLTGNREQSIDSYQTIVANSQYTQGWIKKMWHRDAEILYPVCEDMGPPLKKEKIILNVGRFFADNGESHHKRQDMLIDTFSKMEDLHEAGWTLHFVGSTADDPKSVEYIEKVKTISKKLPVELHFNADFDTLKGLYQKAAIYWHATGFGFDTTKLPQTQEHFGITTVEAMSAGAVPVVVNGGGQPETVSHAKNGYLWDNIEVLQRYTRQVASDDKLRQKMSLAAVERSKQFNKPSFNKSLDRLMSKVNI